MRKSNDLNGKVIPLLLNGQMAKDHIADEVINHWESLRNGRLVPKRSEIDPRKLLKSLNYTFILEATEPDNIRFRLAGSKLCECMGMEMRGMPAYSMITLKGRNSFSEIIQTCLTLPQILTFRLNPKANMTLLPMADEFDNINRILGCITVDASHPEFPKRFSVLATGQTRIITAKSAIPRQVLEMAENQQPFQPQSKKAAPGKPPFLRLIK